MARASCAARSWPRRRASETIHLVEPRPGKTPALETALRHVDTRFVALGDADTIYPPHYLACADALFAAHGDKMATAMAIDVYGDPEGWRARLRRHTRP